MNNTPIFISYKDFKKYQNLTTVHEQVRYLQSINAQLIDKYKDMGLCKTWIMAGEKPTIVKLLHTIIPWDKTKTIILCVLPTLTNVKEAHKWAFPLTNSFIGDYD